MINLKNSRLSIDNMSFFNVRHMNKYTRRFACVGDTGRSSFGTDHASVPHLATAFSVKRRLVQCDLNFAAFVNVLNQGTVSHQANDLTFSCFSVITKEIGCARLVHNVKPNGRIRRFTRSSPRRARLGLLLFHSGVKAFGINTATLFAQSILRQVEWKTVCVVQFKRRRTRKIGTFSQTFDFVI